MQHAPDSTPSRHGLAQTRRDAFHAPAARGTGPGVGRAGGDGRRAKREAGDLSRRALIRGAVAGGAAIALARLSPATPGAPSTFPAPAVISGRSGPHELPPLPYAPDALAPHVSARTLEFHHGKHHKAYVDKTNELAKQAGLADLPLEELVRRTAGEPDRAALFNNAAQVWNHTFFWSSMSPRGGGAPKGPVAERIDADLGGYERFRQEFTSAALNQFGSGWAWLVLEGGKLRIVSTPNAQTPLTTGAKPLLTLDVWEHAYYLDHQNRRGDFVKAYLDHLVSWGFAESNLG